MGGSARAERLATFPGGSAVAVVPDRAASAPPAPAVRLPPPPRL